MSDPTPEAKRAVEMIMREFHHASEFVMEQHVQQALDAITDKSLKLFADALAEKDKVIEGLRSALSSNLCSEHQTPDPLNCDTCNKVTSLTGANLERMAMIDRLQALLEIETEFRLLAASKLTQAEKARDELVEAARPFTRLADVFDVEPYNKKWPDSMRLVGNDVIDQHNYLTLGDLRKLKATLLARIDAKGEK